MTYPETLPMENQHPVFSPGRRHFIRHLALLSSSFAILPSCTLTSRLRVGFIGTGEWGRQYLAAALQHKELLVTGVCDEEPAALRAGMALCTTSGHPSPAHFTSYADLLQCRDIELVVIAAPWHRHFEIAMAALKAGKHVACGPVMGSTLDEHYQIVRTSGQMRRQYFTLEENSSRADLMAVANMARRGIFGELDHVYAGADHATLAEQHHGTPPPYPVYPATVTAAILGLDHCNGYTSITAQQGESEQVIKKRYKRGNGTYSYITQGLTLRFHLTTSKGQQLWLQADAGAAQPVATAFHVSGHQARWVDISHSIQFLEPGNTRPWENDGPWLQQYAHSPADALQHYRQPPADVPVALALHQVVTGLQQQHPPAVYDAARNSAIGLLGAASARQRNATLAFPDFSRS